VHLSRQHRQAPASDVVVSLSITGSPAGFSVTPATMTLKSDVNVGYFQVVVSSTAASNTPNSGTVAFALSGVNADDYSIGATGAFTIMDTTANACLITSCPCHNHTLSQTRSALSISNSPEEALMS